MSSANKHLFLFIIFFLQMSTASEFFAKCCSKTVEKIAPAEMLTLNASSSKLLGNDMLQFSANFMDPDSVQKMESVSKRWSNIKIYETVSLGNEYEMTMFRYVKTGKILWEATKWKNLWVWKRTIPDAKKLVFNLRRNDPAKWNDVFVWFVENRRSLSKSKSQNAPFLKELMLAMAENFDVTSIHKRRYPLMLAATIDVPDYISTLIQRGTDVNQSDDQGWTALHFAAAMKGRMNVCTSLLKNDANIDATDRLGWTPLMVAAVNGRKDMFKFLIDEGANKYLTNNDGQTASQMSWSRME